MIDEHDVPGQALGGYVVGWKGARRPERLTIRGRFCRLEPLDPTRHGPELHAANALDSDGRMWTYLPYGPFSGWIDYRNWLESMAVAQDPVFFAVVDGRWGRAIGVASYLRVDASHGSIEVGHLGYSPYLQRTPAATEAMAMMMRYAFALGYRRYEWKCDALNLPSRRAAERLGFRFEGIFRQAAVVKGRNRDTAWYSIIDSEWPALERAFDRWLAPSNFDAQGQQIRRLSDFRDDVGATASIADESPPTRTGDAAG